MQRQILKHSRVSIKGSMTKPIPDSINLGTRKCCSYDKKSSPVNKWLHKQDLYISCLNLTCNPGHFHSNYIHHS